MACNTETVNNILNSLPDDWKFLENIFDMLDKENALLTNYTELVTNFVEPDQLKKILDVTIDDTQMSREQLFELCQKVIAYSVKTNHPYFRNQLFGQMDPYGLAGAWLSEALNTSAYTFEVAPVFSLIETEIIETMCRQVNYKNGDGIFSPGGSISNMYGIVLARYKLFPKIKENGISSIRPMVMFTSEESHYSFQKGAHWLGIGTENCIKVKTDHVGRMLSSDLETKILKSLFEDKIPFFVNATAGSTVLGAFDDINETSAICRKYNLWLHVDACHGGSVLLSKKNKYLMNGIENSDSVAWDAHKALGTPLQCALFLTKHKGLLDACNNVKAKYLFQQDKFYDISYDTGNKSVQCGRKIDAFKLWLMFKARGLMSYGLLIDHVMNMAMLFVEKIEAREGFRLIQNNFQYTNVCFWYIPKEMRNQKEDECWWQKLYTVAPKLKKEMVLQGTVLVGYTPLPYRNLGNFWRFVFSCFSILTEQDLDYFLDEIERLDQS